MSDLDARVAALMEHVDALHHLYGVAIKPLGLAVFRANIENAIRAELQKPALHEPCTYEEANKAMNLYCQSGPVIEAMKAAINSVLQGRAKPALHEPCIPTPAQAMAEMITRANAQSIDSRLCAIAQPAQEEITDALTKDQVDSVLEKADELFQAGVYGDIKRHVKAVGALRKHLQSIRASKGEKT